jgi:phosphonate transport system substrate-binding protein
MGETNGFFGEVVEAGYHSKAIEMVAAGEVDGAAIDTQVLEIALRDNPVLATQVKVIETLGPSTIQPVVAASGLPLTLKTELRDALMIAGAFPQVAEAYDRCLVRRFEGMVDSDFDDIRKMLLIADQAGITQLG